jgi:hypothetical protein
MLCQVASRSSPTLSQEHLVYSKYARALTFHSVWQAAAPGPWEGGGLTTKQLGALERISEHMEAAGGNVIHVSE